MATTPAPAMKGASVSTGEHDFDEGAPPPSVASMEEVLFNELNTHDLYFCKDVIEDINILASKKHKFDSEEQARNWLRPRLSKLLRYCVDFSAPTVLYKKRIDLDNVCIEHCPFAKFKSLFSSFVLCYRDEEDKVKKFSLPSYVLSESQLHIDGSRYFPHNELTPDEGSSRFYNTFPGFKAKMVETLDMEKIKPVLAFIRDVLSAGNDDYYQWFLAFLADMIQHPTELKGVSPLLYGRLGGEGKSMFMNFLIEMILGEINCLRVQNLSDLMKWSHHLADKLLVYVDELFVDGDHPMNTMESLKTKVSEKWIEITRKNHDSRRIKNCCHFMSLTNNDWIPYRAGVVRRIAPNEVSPCFVGDFAYFVALSEVFRDQEVADHFYTFLCTLDLSAMNLNMIPSTEFRDQLLEQSMKPQDAFVKAVKDGLLEEEMKSIARFSQSRDKVCVVSVEVYSVFKEFCKTRDIKPCKDATLYNCFAKAFTPLTGNGVYENANKYNCLTGSVERGNVRKGRLFTFPFGL